MHKINEEEIKNEKMLNAKELLPNFEIKSYKLLNTGANSEAFIVNNEFIFRFPLKSEVFEDYKIEKKILDIINPYVKSTKIPKIEIFSNNKIFFSKHKIIEGVDFYKSNIKSSSKKQAAKQLANFYFELHSIDVDKFDFLKERKFHLEGYDITNEIDKLREILGDNFKGDNINKKMDYLYKVNNNFSKENCVLCHGDIHEENIIINNDSLFGIIDFGNAFIGDRNIDFSSLLEYDVDFGLATIKEYEHIVNKTLDIKYIFYLQQFRCYSNLLYFVDTNNKKYIDMFKSYINNLNCTEELLLNL